MTRRQQGLPDPGDDEAFGRHVRTTLLTLASSVEPDPAGWRQLNARIRRRRSVVRGAGLALAGAAMALVAVTVLPGGSDPRVEFAPADPAAVADSTAPAPDLPDVPAAEPTPPPTTVPSSPTTPTDAVGPKAAGMLFSDGSSVHVADLDGTITSTPAALGVSTQTVTDVVVRPGGTTETFTMAYRVDGLSDVAPEGCGDIAWVHVPGGGAIDSSGAVPRTGATAQDCLGAPVFASDGSALGWLATTADGEVQLQVVDWGEEGPVAGSLRTFGLDPKLDAVGLSDPQLLELTLEEPTTADAAASGALIIRGTAADGLRTYRVSIERKVDGGLELPPFDAGVAELLHETEIGGTIVDADLGWRLVRLPTADEEERVGLATASREVDGQQVPPLTAETELLLDVAARPFLDVLGDTAVIGVGQALFLVQTVPGDAEAPGSLMIDGELPPATSAALLATP